LALFEDRCGLRRVPVKFVTLDGRWAWAMDQPLNPSILRKR